MFAELGDTVVVVLRLFTVRDTEPELTTCVLSPEYVEVIFTEPAVEGGLYVSLQVLIVELAVERVHDELLKLPPAPPSLHDMVPVGVVSVPELVSLTVASKAIVDPILTVGRLGEIFVVELGHAEIGESSDGSPGPPEEKYEVYVPGQFPARGAKFELDGGASLPFVVVKPRLDENVISITNVVPCTVKPDTYAKSETFVVSAL